MHALRMAVVVAALAALGVAAGCGRKAQLDTPYDAAVQARKDAKKNNEPLPPEPTPPNRDKPFVLDWLIK